MSVNTNKAGAAAQGDCGVCDLKDERQNLMAHAGCSTLEDPLAAAYEKLKVELGVAAAKYPKTLLSQAQINGMPVGPIRASHQDLRNRVAASVLKEAQKHLRP